MSAETIRSDLDTVLARIAKLEGRIPDDSLSEHFVGGRVGGSGNPARLARLNRTRERQTDRLIDRAVDLAPLYRERERLRARLEDVESGWADARERLAAEAAGRVRESIVGDVVLDAIYGVVTVHRVNQRGLTIRTGSGYTEARGWSMIADNLTRLSERDETL